MGGWVHRQMARPTPRCLRWLDQLEDRCPVWALPWLLVALLAAVVGAAAGTGWGAGRCLRA